MTVKTIKELKREIISLPNLYKEALDKQTQKILEVERLEREISKVKKTLFSETDIEDREILDDNDDIELISLETDLDKLKLKISRTEYEVELKARKTTEKVTESHIKALIGTNEELYKLKVRYIDEQANLKTKKSELKKQQQEQREKERLLRWQVRKTPESQDLDNLENQLLIAKSEQFSSNDEVEVLKIKFESYRLLVELESIEELD